MAVQTGTGVHAVTGCGALLKGRLFGIEGAHMPARIMAALAELGNPVRQELAMIAAVRRMARLAVLFDRRVFPEEGPPFLCMAFVTELIDRIALDHLLAEPAMLVMTIRALHAPFTDGMVRLLVDLAPDIAMAGNTQFGLRGFEIFLLPRMDRVAIVAGDAGRFVRAHIPRGHAPGFGMALQAFGGFGRPVRFLLAEDEDVDTAATAFLDVRFPISMTGFAAFSIRGAFAYGFSCMGGIDVRVIMSLMAGFACFRIPSRLATPDFMGRNDPPEENNAREKNKPNDFFAHHILL